jgi:hypothetical protein
MVSWSSKKERHRDAGKVKSISEFKVSGAYQMRFPKAIFNNQPSKAKNKSVVKISLHHFLMVSLVKHP